MRLHCPVQFSANMKSATWFPANDVSAPVARQAPPCALNPVGAACMWLGLHAVKARRIAVQCAAIL